MYVNLQITYVLINELIHHNFMVLKMIQPLHLMLFMILMHLYFILIIL